MPQSLEWIFFDVGYTLLDETPAWADQFQRLSAALKGLGRDVSPQQIDAYYHSCCIRFEKRQWKAIVNEFAPTPDDAAALLRLADGWRFDLETPFPGVKPMLAELSRHWKLGIIANQARGTRERMERHGLLEHLSLVIGSAEAGVHKPDPRIFEMALKQAGCEPARALMVGDRLDNDIAPAKRLGMRAIHVRQGGSGRQQPRDADDVPTASIDQIAALTPAIVRSVSEAPINGFGGVQ